MEKQHFFGTSGSLLLWERISERTDLHYPKCNTDLMWIAPILMRSKKGSYGLVEILSQTAIGFGPHFEIH